jgi:hypothetical protein
MMKGYADSKKVKRGDGAEKVQVKSDTILVLPCRRISKVVVK